MPSEPTELTFLGFLGLIDPLRPGGRKAVALELHKLSWRRRHRDQDEGDRAPEDRE